MQRLKIGELDWVFLATADQPIADATRLQKAHVALDAGQVFAFFVAFSTAALVTRCWLQA